MKKLSKRFFVSLCALLLVFGLNTQSIKAAGDIVSTSDIISIDASTNTFTTNTASTVDPITHATVLNFQSRVFYFDAIPFSESGPIDIAGYQDWGFYNWSEAEPLALQMDADTVTCYATCEGDVADQLTFHLEDLNNTSYDLALPFIADGVYETFGFGVPAGRYYVYFTSHDSSIKKIHAMAVFSRFGKVIRTVPMVVRQKK